MNKSHQLKTLERLPWRFRRGHGNAISDVGKVRVGHLTLSRDVAQDSGQKVSVRTGVTAILPSPMEDDLRFFFGFSRFGGGNEFTGYAVTEDFAYLNSPLALANPYDVGTVYNAILSCGFLLGRSEIWPPVVLSVDDSFLNGADSAVVKDSEIIRLLQNASNRAVEEGSVGIGTGLKAFDGKGGIGTSSRLYDVGEKPFMVGALVAVGYRNTLQIIGSNPSLKNAGDEPNGSLCMILATDTPLLPHQIRQVTGGIILSLPPCSRAESRSDARICLLFSTSNAVSWKESERKELDMTVVDDSTLDGVIQAGSEAVKEAILRSLCLSNPVEGKQNRRLNSLTEDRFAQVCDAFAKTL